MRFAPLLALTLMATVALAGCASQDTNDPTSNDPVVPDLPVPGSENAVPRLPDREYNLEGPYSRVLQEGVLDVLPVKLVTLQSEIDGADIEMALWLPDTNESVPVMLFSSPYFFETGSIQGSARTVDNPGGAVQNLIEQLVPHGYAFATHSVRGMAGSDGCNDLMGPDEIADLDQAVTWLGTQKWSTGNIAMTGVSYDGSTPWSAASTGNPHIKTIIPISGVPDIHGLMYRNGSSETRGPLVLNALYYEIGLASGAPDNAPERALCPEAWEGILLSGAAGVTGYDPTGYWQERNRKPGVEANYKGSVFSVQGLQDWNVDPSQVVPWVDELNKTGIKTKQLLGQWGHAWPDGIGTKDTPNRAERLQAFRADYNEILLRWLESELKGKDVNTGPAVQVRDDIGRWRNEAHYPPRDTTWTPYYLSNTGYLVGEDPQDGEVLLAPNLLGMPSAPEQLNAGVMELAADFVLGPFENETLIVGLPKVHVTVVPHGPGGYMAAYLYERTPDGDLRRMGWTTMNLLYAAGGTEPVPVVPGQPLEVKMEVQPMDSVIREDSSLVVRLWVFTDGDRLPTLPPTGVTLQLGEESVVKVPTVKRSEAYYFEPPGLPDE